MSRPEQNVPRTNSTRKERKRAFCFTLNNFTDAEVQQLKLFSMSTHVSYMLFEGEHLNTGTPHL